MPRPEEPVTALHRGADLSFEAVCGVANLLDTPITLLDLEGRILYLNPAYERLLGRPAASFLGLTIDAVLPVEARARRAQFRRGAALFADLVERGSGRAVFPNQRSNGKVVQVEVVAEVIRREDRASSWILALVSDLGRELEQLDVEIAGLRQLAGAGDDLLGDIVRVARPMLGARYAAIHLIEDGEIVGIVQDGMSADQVAAIGSIPAGRGLFHAMKAADRPVRLRDAGSDRRAVGVPSGHPPIHSILAVPMSAGDQRYGTIYFGDKEQGDEFTVVDERLAEVFAIHGAIAIRDQRERTAMAASIETLRTREQQLEAAQRIAGVGSWERDMATGRLTWSSEAHRLLGLKPESMPATSAEFLAYVHPDDRAAVARADTELPVGNPPPIEYRIVLADGSERVVHETSEVVRDSAGKPRTQVGATQDVTERVAGEAERARIASALAQIGDGVFIFDPDLVVTYANAAAGRMYGYAVDEIVGRELTIINSGSQGHDFFPSVYDGAREGRTWTGSITNRHRNGTLVHADVSITPMFDTEGWVTGIIESHRDVTARVAADSERERLASGIEQAPNPVWIMEPDGTVSFVNAAVSRVYGYTSGELIGRDPSILNSGLDDPEAWDERWSTVRGGRRWSGTIVNRAKDGSLVEVESTMSALLDDNGQITAIIATDRDVTRERALESDLERQARERESIEAALRDIDPSASPEDIAAAACREIVRLADVGSAAVFDLTPGAETTLGLAGLISGSMEVGVPIPELVADSLRARTVAGPWIHDARLDPIGSDSRATVTTTGLQSVAYAPFSSLNGTIGVIGIGSHDPESAPRLVERLSALTIFGSMLGALLGPELDARHRGTEAQALVRANIEDSAFTSFFQPVVELETGRVAGYEALTRFSGHQGPALAFAAAARAGLGVELETATLAGAVKAAQLLPPDVYLSVNASPEFVASGAARRILTGIGRPIVLEITEHVPIKNYSALRRTLASFGPNVRLAVDDAGAGFASFRHILELAPDFVKLDIGLVRGIDGDPARQALVAGMAFFAAERKLTLIAEGIETTAELETVRRLGVQLGQGYLLGRPQAGRKSSSWKQTVEVSPLG